MQVVDPGHEYLLDSYDGGNPIRLVFVKRECEGYPFNVGHHSGTNCQEILRALIDRVKYLQRQIPCEENEHIITDLRSCLWGFERRAAQRHGRASVFPWREQYQTIPIEEQLTCAGCGHVGCEGQHRVASPVQASVSTEGDAHDPHCCARYMRGEAVPAGAHECGDIPWCRRCAACVNDAVAPVEQSRTALDEIEAALISIADGVSPQEAVGKAFNIINAERARSIAPAPLAETEDEATERS